jgi:two-component system chemotaxis response regulator CheB
MHSDPALVVVGASAGGVEALQSMIAGLPADLPAAVLVVLHLPRVGPTALPHILDRAGPLRAIQAVDGELLRPGQVYVAPNDHHLLVIDGHVRLSHGPTENGHRPAIDPLFRSAARAAGARTVAVVLSGARDDGTAGAVTVAAHRGAVFAQDPDEALCPSMPRSVLDHVDAARACPVVELGPAVATIVMGLPAAAPAPRGGGAVVRRPPAAPAAPTETLASLETAMADLAGLTTEHLPGQPAALACPACHGGLFELPGRPTPRFRCWVGHAWSPESLLDEQATAFEGALWMALRSLQEKAALARRMGTDAERRGSPAVAGRYATLSRDAEQAGDLIRELIRQIAALTEPAG